MLTLLAIASSAGAWDRVGEDSLHFAPASAALPISIAKPTSPGTDDLAPAIARKLAGGPPIESSPPFEFWLNESNASDANYAWSNNTCSPYLDDDDDICSPFPEDNYCDADVDDICSPFPEEALEAEEEGLACGVGCILGIALGFLFLALLLVLYFFRDTVFQQLAALAKRPQGAQPVAPAVEMVQSDAEAPIAREKTRLGVSAIEFDDTPTTSEALLYVPSVSVSPNPKGTSAIAAVAVVPEEAENSEEDAEEESEEEEETEEETDDDDDDDDDEEEETEEEGATEEEAEEEAVDDVPPTAPSPPSTELAAEETPAASAAIARARSSRSMTPSPEKAADEGPSPANDDAEMGI